MTVLGRTQLEAGQRGPSIDEQVVTERRGFLS